MSPSRTPYRFLANVVMAAAFLRLFHLDRFSLWLDEGVTWAHATRPTFFDTLFAEANHPPVWRCVTRLSIAAFGDSEFSLRLPAAILGVLSVVLAYFLARRLTDPERTPSRGGFLGLDGGAPFWVAGLAAAGAFWIEYAQEARMYSALLAETLGLSLLYLRWLDGGKRWCLVLYGLLAAVALYTHYFAAFFLAGHLVHAGLTARRRSEDRVSALPLLATLAGAGLLFLPWVIHLMRSYGGFSHGAKDPVARLLHAIWRIGVGPGLVAADRSRLGASWGDATAEDIAIIAGSALLWILPIALGIRALWRDRGARDFLLSSVLVPLGLALLVFPWFPLIEEKYFVFLAPPLLLLAVVGARAVPPWAKPLLLGGLVVLTVAGLAAYHFGETDVVQRTLTGEHPYGKEQWREAWAWVQERKEPGDVVLLQPPFAEVVWDYYDKPPDRGLLPFDAASAEAVLEKFPQIAKAKRVFLVLAHETTDDRDYYVNVLRELWLRPEMRPLETGILNFDLHLFPRSWGIRVFEYSRE